MLQFLFQHNFNGYHRSYHWESSSYLGLDGWKFFTNESGRQTGHGAITIRCLVAMDHSLPPSVPPPMSGRPKETFRGKDMLLWREVLMQSDITAGQWKKMHPQLLHGVTERTVQHCLQKELGLSTRSAAEIPLLTKPMIKKRLAFAQKYLHWTVKQWWNVLFCDKNTFRRVRWRPQIRHPQNSDCYAPRHKKRRMKLWDSVMLWGAFSGSVGCRGDIFPSQEWDHEERQVYWGVGGTYDTFFQIISCDMYRHYGASSHHGVKVNGLLHGHNIQVLDKPGNSSDMNPIENDWNYIKNQLATCNTASVPHWRNEITKMQCTHKLALYPQTLTPCTCTSRWS